MLVEPLLREVIAGSLRRHQRLCVDDAVNADMDDCRRAAVNLLSKDARQAGVITHIDQHIGKWCGVIADNPTDRVAGGLISMLTEVHEIANSVEETVPPDEHWQAQIDEVIRRYSLLLMGLTLGEIAAVATRERHDD